MVSSVEIKSNILNTICTQKTKSNENCYNFNINFDREKETSSEDESEKEKNEQSFENKKRKSLKFCEEFIT